MIDALRQKLKILADAAKYDASCASSGVDTCAQKKVGLETRKEWVSAIAIRQMAAVFRC